MKVSHPLLDKRVEKSVDLPVSFFLTNHQGGYLQLATENRSRYEGLFLFDGEEMFRTLADIRLPEAGNMTEIVNNLTHVERKYGQVSEQFHMIPRVNGCVYELSKKQLIAITLDCKHSYDNDEFGRNYQVHQDGDEVTVSFQKKQNEHTKYELWCQFGFEDSSDFTLTDTWPEIEYPFDASREASHAKRYVYQPFSIRAKRMFVGIGKTQQAAQQELIRLKQAWENQHKVDEKYRLSLRKLGGGSETEQTAFLCAQNALEELSLPDGHLFAGLPWFFQRWTRDEAISVGALIRLKHFDRAKRMLYELLDTVEVDGRIPNKYPLHEGELQSADGIWWVLVRLHELMTAIENEDHLDEFFEFSELIHLRDEVHEVIAHLIEHHSAQNLEWNEPLETWMDTVCADDVRQGARIEMQALRLRGLEFLTYLAKLTGDDATATAATKTQKSLATRVKKHFFQGNKLADGFGDDTIRPNMFLAAYLYPKLLKKTEWKTVLTHALPALWTDWGGLASIDTAHTLFQSEHTGPTNESYHRGDVWYFINNIAAMVLLDFPTLESYADKIIQSSTDELLWSGGIGCGAEISSFSESQSNGCLNQAWSNATYIELLLKKYRKK